MHEYAPLAVTLVAIFAGILLNRSDTRATDAKIEALRLELKGIRLELKGDIADLRSTLNERLVVIESDLRAFYQITGELKWRLDAIEKRH
jgi:hypothetical protein